MVLGLKRGFPEHTLAPRTQKDPNMAKKITNSPKKSLFALTEDPTAVASVINHSIFVK